MSQRRAQQTARHRRKRAPRRLPSVQWLRVGVVTAGLGAAIATGQGVATASTGDDAGATSTNGGRSDVATGSSSIGSASTNSSSADSQASDDAGADDADSIPAATGSEDPAPAEEPEPGTEAELDDVANADADADGSGEPEPITEDYSLQPEAGSEPAESDDSEATTPSDDDADYDESIEKTVADTDTATDEDMDALAAGDDAPASTRMTLTGTAQGVTAVVVRPVNLQTIVADVMHWIGLGSLASQLSVPALPVSSLFESLWLAVRDHQYKWNNQRPAAEVTISGQDPRTGVVTGKIIASDYDDTRLTFVVSTDPINGTVVVDAAGNFTYTPTSAVAIAGGADTFVITVDDRPGNPEHYYGLLGLVGLVGPTRTRVRVSVVPVTAANQMPRAGEPPYDYTVDEETGIVTGSVKASDPDGDPLGYQLSEAIDSTLGTLQLDSATGGWVFNPTDLARYQAWATPGPDTLAFAIWVSDGVDRIRVNVEAPILGLDTPNGAPEPGTPPYAYTVNTDTGIVRGTINVTHADGDALRYRLTGAPDPSLGTAVVNATTGQWAFRPTAQARFAAWKAGEQVSQAISITVTDGRASSVITIDAPVIPAATLHSDVVDGVGVQPAGVALSSDGRVYIASSGDGTVRVINADGSQESPIRLGGNPFGLASGPGGRFYVTDVISGKVSVFTATGAVQSFATVANASGLTVDEGGHVYVTSLSGTNLTVFSPDAQIIQTVELGGVSPGIAVGADGRIYAAVLNSNFTGGSIHVLAADGTTLDTFDVGADIPYRVAVDSIGRLYVTDVNGTLTILKPDGTTLKSADLSDGVIAGVATGPDGRIYVTGIDGDLTVLMFGPVPESVPGQTVDPDTGVVKGMTDILDPGGFTYSVPSPPNAAIGAVEIDADTGAWAFTPTAQARSAAVSDPAAATVSFTIIVSGGAEPVTIAVTAPISPDSSPEAGDPPFTITSVDADTGKVTGQVRVTDLDGDPLLYLVASGIDPTRGRIVVNPLTGEFTFTPTELASHHAWFTPGDDSISLTVFATDGETDAAVKVTVPVTARHPDQDGVLTSDELAKLAALGDILLARDDDGTVRAIDGTFTLATVSNSAEAAEVLNQIAELLGAAADFADSANIISTLVESTIPGGQVRTENIYVLKPTVNGIAVLGSEVVLVVDGTGVVTGVFSDYDGRLDGFDTNPNSVVDTEEEAAAAAATAFAGDIDSTLDPTVLAAMLATLSYDSELVVYALDSDAGPTLTWQVTISTKPIPADPDPEGQQNTSGITLPVFSTIYYLTATGLGAGTVLTKIDTRDSAWSPVLVQADDFDSNLPAYIYVEKDGNKYRLVDTRRKITIYNTAYHGFGGVGAPVVGEDIVEFGDDRWDDNGNEEGAWALANMAKIYDFYRDSLRWDFNKNYPSGIKINLGYDDSRGGWEVLTGGNDYQNAAWNWGNDQFEIGSGRWEAALDVLAHEFTHAVIGGIVGEKSWTSGERGAMNEAYADILGSLIENKSGSARWITGDDATYQEGQRDMKDPTSKTDPNGYTYRDHYDSRYIGPYDDGGEHLNSTILSHAAYLMMDDDPRTAGISREDWAGVFYGSLQLRPNSFQDARTKIVRVAKSHGFEAEQIAAIEYAFDRVGIDAAYIAPSPSSNPYIDPELPDVKPPFEGLSLPGAADSPWTWGKPMFSSDGKRAVFVSTFYPVTGYSDNATTRVALLDASTGEQVGATFVIAGVGSVEFNEQGTRAIVSSAVSKPLIGFNAARIAVLDTATGNQIGRTVYASGYPHAMKFNDAGTVAVLALTDYDYTYNSPWSRIVMINTNTGAQVGSGFHLAGQPADTIFNSSGTRVTILTESPDESTPTGLIPRRLAVFDTTTGAQVGPTMEMLGGSVNLVTGVDGSRVVVVKTGNYTGSGSHEPTVQFTTIDTATGTQIGTSVFIPGSYYVISSMAAGRLVMTGQFFDQSTGSASIPIVVLDTNTGKQIGTTVIVDGGGGVSLKVNRDGTRAAIAMSGFNGSNTSRVMVIDMVTGTQIGTTTEVSGGNVVDTQFNADGTRVTVAVSDEAQSKTRLLSINTATGMQVGQTLNAAIYAPVHWDTAGYGRYVIVTESTSNLQNRLTVFDTTSGIQVGATVALPVQGAVIGAQINDDATRVVITQQDNVFSTFEPEHEKVLVWVVDIATGQLINGPVKISGWNYQMAKLAGDRAIVTGESDHSEQGATVYATEVAVIDVATGAQVGETLKVRGVPDAYRDRVQISPDGSRGIIVTTSHLEVGGTYIATTELMVVSMVAGVQIGETLTISGIVSGPVQFTVQDGRAGLIAMIQDPETGMTRSHLVLFDTANGEVLDGAPSTV